MVEPRSVTVGVLPINCTIPQATLIWFVGCAGLMKVPAGPVALANVHVVFVANNAAEASMNTLVELKPPDGKVSPKTPPTDPLGTILKLVLTKSTLIGPLQLAPSGMLTVTNAFVEPGRTVGLAARVDITGADTFTGILVQCREQFPGILVSVLGILPAQGALPKPTGPVTFISKNLVLVATVAGSTVMGRSMARKFLPAGKTTC